MRHFGQLCAINLLCKLFDVCKAKRSTTALARGRQAGCQVCARAVYVIRDTHCFPAMRNVACWPFTTDIALQSNVRSWRYSVSRVAPSARQGFGVSVRSAARRRCWCATGARVWRTAHSAGTRKMYRTRDEAKADVFDYIEGFYNAKRRHSRIGYKSPMEFEMQAGLA